MNQLNPLGQSLLNALAYAKNQAAVRQADYNAAEKIHIVGAGGALTAAYEQLRNAAEYTEEHVLLQRAIRRFYRRLFFTRDTVQIAQSGEELAIELTLAGYIPNDTIVEGWAEQVNQLANRYYDLYQRLESTKGVSRQQVEGWSIDVLAVEVELLLNDDGKQTAFIQVAHDYYRMAIEDEGLFNGVTPADVEAAQYVAIHRALLKSDLAVIRLGLLRRYRQTPASPHYMQTNQQIDALFDSPTTDKLYHFIDRRGAPLRVLRHMIEEDEGFDQLLGDKDAFLSAFEAQVMTEYTSVNRRINRGIVKSVIFLIITKFLIGIAIEVPYDYLIAGMIAWTPLLINLFFPPVYMILLRATLMLPGRANTTRLVTQIDRILYGQTEGKQLARRRRASFGMAYSVAYALFFVLIFGGVGVWLWLAFHFQLLHLAIFFTFLSAASFLGFRLSRMIRELEAVDSQQNGITLARDFLYMPFVVVGRWMSDKYTKVNIVAMTLDMVIELPLKTVLRLIRQWGAFISSKKDEL